MNRIPYDEVLQALRSVGCDPYALAQKKQFSCPWCLPWRKAIHRRDRDLTVWPKPDGFTFFCHHCSEKGGYFNERFGTGRRQGFSKSKDQSRNGRTPTDIYRPSRR